MVLLVLASVWLAIRVVAGLRMLVRPPDRVGLADAHRVDPEPQDALWSPQDATPVDRRGPTRAAPTAGLTAVGLAVLVVALVRQQLDVAVRAVGAGRVTTAGTARGRRPSTPSGDPIPEGLAAFHATVIDRVHRPGDGPACFGGRDSAAYLRGWDDAVDWVGKAHDAEPPTWGDVAYMTGWTDAVHAVGRARRCAIG